MLESVLRNGCRDCEKRHESYVMLRKGMFSLMNSCRKLSHRNVIENMLTQGYWRGLSLLGNGKHTTNKFLISRIGIWKCWFLRRRVNRRTNNKLNPHMTPSPGIEPGPHWWEASALSRNTCIFKGLPETQHYFELFLNKQ